MAQQLPFIDMHAHFFNGRYLPLDGILRSKNVPPLISKALTLALVPLVGKSNFKETNSDAPDVDILDALLNHDDAYLFKGIVKRVVRKLEKYADKQMNDPSAEQELADLIQGLSLLDAMRNTTDGSSVFSGNFSKRLSEGLISVPDPGSLVEFQAIEETLFWAFSEVDRTSNGLAGLIHDHDGGENDIHDPINGLISKAHVEKSLRIGGFGTLGQVIRFLASMFLSERNRYRLITEDYAKNKPDNGYDPTHFLGVLLDMEKPYEHLSDKRPIRPKYNAQVQTQRMVALAKDTGGHIITFGAVDPFREHDWEDYIDAAVELGVNGFKFYPPMGVRAANKPSYKTKVNPAAKHSAAYQKAPPNSTRLNRTAKAILKRMNSDGLRVFTHCTPEGFETVTGNGINSDPTYWDHAIDTYHLHDLWLYLGHGGGASAVDWNGWYASVDNWTNTFAYRAVEMCKKHKNVYMGLGNIAKLFADQEGLTMIPRLKTLLAHDDNATYQFRDKLCYGTDWSMPLMIGKTREYLGEFYEIFDDPLISEETARKFFQGNAEKFIGL